MNKKLAIVFAVFSELVMCGFLYICWLEKPSGSNPNIIDWVAVIFGFIVLSFCVGYAASLIWSDKNN